MEIIESIIGVDGLYEYPATPLLPLLSGLEIKIFLFFDLLL